MVTVNSFAKRKTTDGREFISLELVSGIEMVQSSNTGKFYATIRRCFIPATFEESVAAVMVGCNLPGEIVRINSDPYEYTIKATGEVVTLQHSYGYQPAPSGEVVQSSQTNEYAQA